MNKRRISVLWLCAVMVWMTSCAALPRDTVPTSMTASVPTAASSTTSVVTTTAATIETGATVPTQTATPEQPSELTAWLTRHALDYESLRNVGCEQLMVVTHDDETFVRFFACTNGQWQECSSMTARACVGKNGVASQKQEGDGCTPRGWYAIGDAFYIDEKPETALPSFMITEDTYWVDDPQSEFYNQRVEGIDRQDWNSAEHMIDYDGYRYGFVIEYNTQAVPNVGSAIFFHVGDHPTLGCIATDKDMVLQYLSKLDPAANPYILIV